MQVYKKLDCSEVNGPGKRAVIWTAGCDLGCAGCWNPETHPKDAGSKVTAMELATWVIMQREVHKIEGVTLSGGEPLQQSAAVADFVTILRVMWPNASIGMFSGYSLVEAKKIAHWSVIEHHLDFAIMGRYVAKLPSPLPLLGSSNQKIELFSHRYTTKDFETVPGQALEIHSEPGKLTITGFPRHKQEELAEELRKLGVKLG